MLDDELLIETPERVELRYALASVGNRFLAAAIDHSIQALILLAIGLVLLAVLGVDRVAGLGGWVAALAVLAVFSVIWGYFVIFETLWRGQTPGKRIMRLRVIREDGRPVRFFEVFVRNIIRFVIDMAPAPPPSFAIGVVSMIFSPRSRRVGDYVAGTVVIKERSTEAPPLEEILKLSEMEERREALVGPASFKADTRLLSDQQMRAVEVFLQRRFELDGPSRGQLAVRIANSVAERLGIPVGQVSPERLLEEVEVLHKVQSRYLD